MLRFVILLIFILFNYSYFKLKKLRLRKFKCLPQSDTYSKAYALYFQRQNMRKYLEGSNLDQTNSRQPVEKIAKMLLTNSQKEISAEERINILIEERDINNPTQNRR